MSQPGPIDIPGEIHLPEISGDALVDALATDLPLTLFPVRLATRFDRPSPGARPTHLRIRIFPDLLHADGHLPELSSDEITIGHAYWDKVWRAGTDAPPADADAWVTGQLGAPRAAWVALQTRPTNPQAAHRRPTRPGAPLDPPPEFPATQPRTEVRPTLARLLPDRWLVVVRRSETVQRVWSEPVRRDLAMAPNLADLAPDGGVRELLSAQDLWWMVDYDEAVAAGMAVTVPWEHVASAPAVDDLLVLGIRGPDDGAVDELTQLLDSQRFTTGLELVPQGTPTNNTDTEQAGYTEVPADLSAYLSRQLDAPTVHRPRLSPPRELGTTTAAHAASIALGLDTANAFDHAEHAGLLSGSWARDMNRTLFPATVAVLPHPAARHRGRRSTRRRRPRVAARLVRQLGARTRLSSRPSGSARNRTGSFR